MVDGEVAEPDLPAVRVGERLRLLREEAGLDLNDIGTRTRIPVRHLAAIEAGDYASLPSPTYSLGFTKAYARAIGADEVPLLKGLREELGREDPALRETLPYEPADPSRVPPRLLAWTAALLAVIIAISYAVWRSAWFASNDPIAAVATVDAPRAAPAPQTEAIAPTAVAPTSRGQVTLVARAPAWVRIRDASGTRLLEKEMAVGERYDVPLTANGPTILTGKADGLQVLIDGREIPPLGPPTVVVKNLPIDARSLAARPPAAAL